MSPEELKALLSTPAALFVLMLAASFGSAWKQMLVARRSGSAVSVKAYFLDNWPETLAMIGHNIAAFVGLIFTDTLNPGSAIGFGYLANDAADAYTQAGRSVSMGGTPRQGGFIRVHMAMFLAAAVAAMVLLSGCANTRPGEPAGERRISAEGQLAVETALRIGMRHALNNPRAAEKAKNIRNVVVRLQTFTSADSTLAGLTALVSEEIDKLNLSPIDKADAQDLLTLFSRALANQLGPEALQAEGVVKVNEFLTLVLATIPNVAAAPGSTSSAVPPG